MTTQPKHTPTPWKFISAKANQAAGAPVIHAIRSVDGRHTIVDLGTLYTDEQKANAAFIVTACNAHAELLAALKGMLDMVRFADQDDDGFACGISLEQSQIIAARAAIAKAEGR